MVPASFHRLDRLPLTANGKTDRKALTALAEDLGPARDSGGAPRTPAERRLAAEWATELGLPRTDPPRRQLLRSGRHVPVGGTARGLAGPGHVPRDLAGRPVLADLARLIDTRTSCER
ncbi:amino acid adenylation protein [Streptomyces purpurascens]